MQITSKLERLAGEKDQASFFLQLALSDGQAHFAILWEQRLDLIEAERRELVRESMSNDTLEIRQIEKVSCKHISTRHISLEVAREFGYGRPYDVCNDCGELLSVRALEVLKRAIEDAQ